jgi:Spy/CpxP family protein refolding chaperone
MKLTHLARPLAVLATLLAVIGVTALAQNGGPPADGRGPFGGRGRGMMMGGAEGLAIERLGGQLNLTDAQRSSIADVLKQEQSSLATALASRRQARQALDAAITTLPLDQGLLQSTAAALSAIDAQIAQARAQTEAQIFALLGSGQQQQVRQWVSDMEAREGSGRGRRGRS